jgi:hypothetical protein
MEQTRNPRFLHYMISHQKNKVIAHCLDYDIVAAADDQEEAIQRLNFIVRSHVETAHRYKNESALQHKAPQEFWDCFEKTNCNQILNLEIGESAIEARFDEGLTAARLVHCEPAYAVQ